MKERYCKTKVLGPTRQVLTEIAAWTDMLYDAGAAERLIGAEPSRDTEFDDGDVAAYVERIVAVKPRDWAIPGSAGPIIERSLVLKNIGRVVDYLNTNNWHGDSVDFWNTKIELTPLYFLLDGAWRGHGANKAIVLSYATDEAVDQSAAANVFEVLKIFFARVNFEAESNHNDGPGELSLSELATISGLAEKTVRMAAIGQDKNPDLVTFKDGRKTFIRVDEARRWLASKNIDYSSPVFTVGETLPPVDPKHLGELGAYLRNVREKSGVGIESLGKLLAWDEPMIEEYTRLEDAANDIDLTRFSLNTVIKLAEVVHPSESAKLVRVIDRVLHPILLELQLEQRLSNAHHHELED